MKADHDPFYNPINDYVILPTAFDMESIKTKGLQVTSLREEWEIIGDDENTTEREPIAVARATIVVQPQGDGKRHVELNAVSISATA